MTMTDTEQRLRDENQQLRTDLARLRVRYAQLKVALERTSEIGHRALIETPTDTHA